ncbi:hypothetical protein [Solidesulfovibrio alcoholivorans]|uniref:hypothetical protein n=1 Tax=Solidesulfovibrio alcoholivorans TaxID=81406 RepID=UPI0004966708|nr:hypothetical protein [Solidesulfovibrio alcoholivorans]
MPNAKPKIHAMKEHRPMMRIDVEKAESLAKLIKEKQNELYKLHDTFIDAINAPFNHVATCNRGEEGQDAYEFMRAANYFFQQYAMDLLVNSKKTGDAIKMAVAALRIFKSQQQNRATVGAESHA